MKLPRAVQQQVDDADAFVAQMSGQTVDDTETSQNPDPQPAPSDPPQPVSQEPQPKPVSEDTWERKYLTLKGMYDAEVPRLHAQTRELNQQVQTLIAETALIKAQQTSAQPSSKPTLITEQDKEAFGSDLLDLIDRAAEQKVSEVRNRNAELLGEIKELKGKLGNVSDRQVVSDKDRFLASLSKQVPDWETLNVDSGFLTWLAEVDPVYGLPRQYGLNNAYEAFDADRTAAIFSQYRATVSPKSQQRAPSLSSQVAPTRSRSTPAPSSGTEKPIFSQAEISQFYDDWMKNKITNDEAVKIEAEIHAAYAEGRIR
jgi:uncharacterized phage infection (PIP) family protein YhgE